MVGFFVGGHWWGSVGLLEGVGDFGLFLEGGEG